MELLIVGFAFNILFLNDYDNRSNIIYETSFKIYGHLIFLYLFLYRYEKLMKINLEAAELGEVSDIHTKLLRVSVYKIMTIVGS